MSDEEILVSGARAKQKQNNIIDNYTTNMYFLIFNKNNISPIIGNQFDLDQYELFNSQINKDKIYKLVEQQFEDMNQNKIVNRFSLWRYLISSDQDLLAQLKATRMEYQTTITKFKTSGQQNPLQNKGLWSGFFQQSEIKTQITKDVERTHQEKEFFQNFKIKHLLTNILLVWSLRNPDSSYRQGMNEIAAEIIYVYFQELQGKIQFKHEDINFINAQYAEEDIFYVFDKIMNQCKHLEAFDTVNKVCPIVNKIRLIQDKYLKQIDEEYYKHLKMLDIEIQIFLIRWMRCIFTREFHLYDSLKIWDAILYDYHKTKDNLQLIECICLSLMLYIRTQVIERQEYSSCVQRLMKYPPVEDFTNIIKSSFEIKQIINETITLEQAQSIQFFLKNKIQSQPQFIVEQKKPQYNFEQPPKIVEIEQQVQLKISSGDYSLILQQLDQIILENPQITQLERLKNFIEKAVIK